MYDRFTTFAEIEIHGRHSPERPNTLQGARVSPAIHGICLRGNGAAPACHNDVRAMPPVTEGAIGKKWETDMLDIVGQ